MATFILCLPQSPTQFYFKDPVRIWLPKHENNKSENLDVFSHSLWLRNLNETDICYSCCFQLNAVFYSVSRNLVPT